MYMITELEILVMSISRSPNASVCANRDSAVNHSRSFVSPKAKATIPPERAMSHVRGSADMGTKMLTVPLEPSLHEFERNCANPQEWMP